MTILRRRTHRMAFRVIVMLLVTMVLSGCEDLLPEYREPDDLFTLVLMKHDSTLFTFYDTNRNDTLTLYKFLTFTDYAMLAMNPEFNSQYYWLSNPFYFNSEFYLENIYEETIQSKSDVQGRCEIWPTKHPDARRTIELDNTLFLGSPHYSHVTKTFTIEPGERIYFYISWDFALDNGKYIHRYASNHSDAKVSSSFTRFTYPPLPITLRLSISVREASKVYVVEKNILLHLQCYYFVSPIE
ncbi:MAG: hypothetical protein ACYC09_05150 [Bacteroidota bacterium]